MLSREIYCTRSFVSCRSPKTPPRRHLRAFYPLRFSAFTISPTGKWSSPILEFLSQCWRPVYSLAIVGFHLIRWKCNSTCIYHPLAPCCNSIESQRSLEATTKRDTYLNGKKCFAAVCGEAEIARFAVWYWHFPMQTTQLS